MDELLFKLTPPEFYVWAFLCSRASEQGGDLVAIPTKPPGPPGWKLYTRRHLKRILQSLETKKYLVITSTPANQHQDLVVVISRRHRLDVDVQASRHECPGDPPKAANLPSDQTWMSRQLNTGETGVLCTSGSGRTSAPGQEDSASASAKDLKALKASVKGVPVSFETLLGLDQATLLKGIMSMELEDLMHLEGELARIAPMARGKKRSRKARVYAAMRFLQSGQQKAKPAAWVEEVAKRADYEMERLGWKDDRSGEGGRSRSRERFAAN